MLSSNSETKKYIDSMVSLVKNALYLKKTLLHRFRPSKEKTGHVSESGASVIKHGLNPEKIFMQVHYLKVRACRHGAGFLR